MLPTGYVLPLVGSHIGVDGVQKIIVATPTVTGKFDPQDILRSSIKQLIAAFL